MILVTGGTGLLGSQVLLQLTKQGHHPKAIIRAGSHLKITEMIFKDSGNEEFLKNIHWIKGDVLNMPSLLDALSDVKKVYHCAALVSYRKKDRQQMLDMNIRGTANIVNACLHHKIEKLCHVSSIAALGGKKDAEGMTIEGKAWEEPEKPSAYALSKWKSELEVWRGMAEGLNAVIVNPSIIIGPGNWNTGSAQLFSTIYKGLKFFTSGITGYVDARDVAAAMILLMDSEIHNERFILNSENISFKTLFDNIATALQKPIPTVHITPLMGEVAWRIFWAISLFSRKNPIITRETAHSAQNVYRYSGEKISKLTGFQYRSIKESIAYTAGIFLKNVSENEGSR
ncbi:MAG: NAD-dependent epimerase/dehydratase family protein [Bacteroidales bacterium]|nr:NAD-dependent epimerase/dehydratase family protein [Bacteroidales bacterium]